MKQPLIIAALAVWLVASCGLKVLRYSHVAPEDSPDGAILIRPIEAEGWRLIPAQAQDKDQGHKAHVRYVFQKAGCAEPLTLIVLGLGAESVGLIDGEFGGRVSYFQNGDLIEKPSAWRNSFSRLAKAFAGLFDANRNNTHAIFAVSPPPPQTSTQVCDGPSVANWKHYLADIKGSFM